MPLSEEDITSIPGLPAPQDQFDDIWVLTFRQGMNPRPQHKNYRFKGNLREAIERFRLFCEQTGRTFVVVTPFLSSIDDEIYKHLNMG